MRTHPPSGAGPSCGPSAPALARLAADGYAVLPRLLPAADCAALSRRLPAPGSTTGSRCLLAQPWCRTLAGRLRRHALLAPVLDRGLVAVQCSYFQKSLARNWLVPVHQDLSVPVAGRVDHPALQGWSEKEGECFVQAPRELLEQMVAVRLHLDACGLEDGPLRVVAGSHLGGLLAPAAASAARRDGPEAACPVPRGGVMLMRPLLLHASSKATGHGARRVLHFLFAPPIAPHGLQWRRRA